MFVLESAREQVLRTRREAFARDFVQPFVHEANQIGITTEELTAMIEKERAQ